MIRKQIAMIMKGIKLAVVDSVARSIKLAHTAPVTAPKLLENITLPWLQRYYDLGSSESNWLSRPTLESVKPNVVIVSPTISFIAIFSGMTYFLAVVLMP